MPTTFRLPLEDGSEIVLVHGSPSDPLEPFTHDMSDEEMLALIGDDPADLVLCGGSHVPFDRTVSGVRVVSLGSVGEAPGGFGDGRRYADVTLIETGAAGLSVEQIVVPLGKAA